MSCNSMLSSLRFASAVNTKSRNASRCGAWSVCMSAALTVHVPRPWCRVARICLVRIPYSGMCRCSSHTPYLYHVHGCSRLLVLTPPDCMHMFMHKCPARVCIYIYLMVFPSQPGANVVGCCRAAQHKLSYSEYFLRVACDV